MKSRIFRFWIIVVLLVLHVQCGDCYIPGTCGDDDAVDLKIKDCNPGRNEVRLRKPIAAGWYSQEITEFPLENEPAVGYLNTMHMFPMLIDDPYTWIDYEPDGQLPSYLYHACDVLLNIRTNECNVVLYCRNRQDLYQIETSCDGFDYLDESRQLMGIDLFPYLEGEILTDVQLCGRGDQGITLEFGIDQLPGVRLKMGVRP